MTIFNQSLTVNVTNPAAGTTFDDEFNTLSLLNTRNTGAGGTWLPAGGIGSSTDGYVNNETWIINPFNPATNLNTVMTASSGILSLNLLDTPSNLSSVMSNAPYIGSRITTEQTFTQKYGYFECRAKVPLTQGTGFAFWMFAYGSPYQEIDVIEIPVADNGTNIDAKASYWNTDQTLSDGIDNFTLDVQNWHTYGVDWQSDFTTFYIDRVQTGQFTSYNYVNPMFMMLEFTDSSTWPSGNTIVAGSLPTSAQVDYVRVWQTKPF